MKKVNFLLLFSFVLMIGVSGCKNGGNSANCSVNWGAEAADELSAISSALMAYTSVGSTENCNALKDAYQDYVDVLETFSNCSLLTGALRDLWQQAIDDAEDEIDTIC